MSFFPLAASLLGEQAPHWENKLDVQSGSPIYATRELQFDSAHRVPYHTSKCKHMHGHRYRIVMEMGCWNLGASGSPDDGMVMDFGIMKTLLDKFVVQPADHATLLWIEDPVLFELLKIDPVVTGLATQGQLFAVDPAVRYNELKGLLNIATATFRETPIGENLSIPTMMGRVVVLPCIPTAENLAKYWGDILWREVHAATAGRAWLDSVTLWETPNCSALCSFGAGYLPPETLHASR